MPRFESERAPDTPREGPVALITGASRGIGLAVARRLAADGWRLALLSRGGADLFDAASEITRSAGVECVPFPADVSGPRSVEGVFEVIEEKFRRLDCVVHCAGILEVGRHDHLDVAAYRRTMEINYLGAVHVALPALARLEPRAGSLILVASVIAIRTFPGFAAYAPSKWALRAFHETLEMETAGSRVHLGLVYPPITDTPMIRRLPPESRPAVYDAFRAMPPQQVAEAIVRGIRKRRRRIFVRASDRLYFHLERIAPGPIGWLLDRRVARAAAERKTP